MKKLVLVFLLATSVVALGQNDKRKTKFDANFTIEQQAILKTKKMALALDLNESQQGKILTLNKVWMKEKVALKESHKSLKREEMSSDQKFDIMNKKLDTKIKQKAEIKNILNEEQYEIWKESFRKRHHRTKIKGTQSSKKEQR